ncbi:16S rRNA processing protein RimM [Lachnospiraceae bacterium NE2001]|nr:16S rRNA processing protein RimM [Lachnospiraceae bacterium NE2001]
MEDYFRVGVLTSPHGVKGEISVYPTSDSLDRYKDLEVCYLKLKDGMKEVHVTSCKYKKNQPVLKFAEYNSIEEIEPLRQIELYIDREHAIALEEGEYYMADIIGFDVIDENGKIGTLKDYTENGADQTIFIVECLDGSTKYILDIPEFIKNVDLDSKTILVNVIKGM